ncbi:hypothetical protein SAMN05216267_1005220 [Actinacidiphila rubida]|uniref:Secreted protein n=1 Tax=Actinacidiphila rubida TaxID=310780 RepID=A0A1H8GPX7_9ACTN|nr:hypothetical protein [Actinacidiphila rubida]SEN46036.1 hypothetical protein SAMN05216267_1005220 [Actinacidiphila rubida]
MHRSSSRAALRMLGAATTLAALLTACGSGTSGGSAHSGHAATPGMTHTATAGSAPVTSPVTSPSGASSGSSSMSGMPGMGDMPGMKGGSHDEGLSDTRDGYRLASATATLPAGIPVRYRFHVTGPGAAPVTDFAVDQTERLHLYAVRTDLTGFQHVHPAMAADGGWTADLAALTPGRWRLYASFTPASGPGAGQDFVLSRTVTVPGRAASVPLPAAAPAVAVDGYTVTVAGDPAGGAARPLTVRFTRGGVPVTGLEPYLGTYAHLTAFHAGDLAFAHLHPATPVNGAHGGPQLAFHAELAKAGDWRLFLQFRAGGTLHTAAVTLHVG